MTTQGGTSWRDVSPAAPCSLCGKSDWCRVSADGTSAICYRPQMAPIGVGVIREDRNGAEYLLVAKRGPRGRDTAPLRRVSLGTNADLEQFDAVYSSLLSMLALSPVHRGDLARRGLPSEEIDRRLYRSLPRFGREAIVSGVVERHGPSVCLAVPGFYTGDDGRVRLSGSSGLLVPCRDLNGRIVALKVRRDREGLGDAADEGPRFTYLSSKKRGGPGPGAPIHVPLHNTRAIDTLRLTEGELKADVATVLSGVLTLSAPGVTIWRPVVQAVREIRPRRVLVAFDMDWKTNPVVKSALNKLADALSRDGFSVGVETWN